MTELVFPFPGAKKHSGVWGLEPLGQLEDLQQLVAQDTDVSPLSAVVSVPAGF